MFTYVAAIATTFTRMKIVAGLINSQNARCVDKKSEEKIKATHLQEMIKVPGVLCTVRLLINQYTTYGT